MAKINVDSTFDNQYHFHELFDRFGWERMLDLPVHYYLALVREFYANIDQKYKGIHIRITRDLLANILGATNEIPLFEHDKTTVTYDHDYIFETVIHKFCYGGQHRQRP